MTAPSSYFQEQCLTQFGGDRIVRRAFYGGLAEARNLLAWSQAYSHNPWIKDAGGGLTDNALVAPDGTLTGAIWANSAGGNDVDLRQIFPVTSGRPYTYSIYCTALSGTIIRDGHIQLIMWSGLGHIDSWSLNIGEELEANSGSWVRFTGTTSGLQTGSATYYIRVDSDALAIGVWGAQLEEITTPRRYSATGSGAIPAAQLDHRMTGELGALRQDAAKPIFPNYTLELENKDLGLSHLATSLWTGQEMLVDFGFRVGTVTAAGSPYIYFDTARIFTGVGREVYGGPETVRLEAEGKFASLSRKKIGTTNSPLAFTGSNWNPADLWWTIVTCYGELDATAGAGNVDINYAAWQQWQAAFDVINYRTQGALEGETVLKWQQALADVTGSWIYEDTGKLTMNFFTPTHPDSYVAVNINESHYTTLTKVEVTDVSNHLRVMHGFDPVSKVWTGEATKISSASVGIYGTIERIWDNELAWHANSASADQFAMRELKNRQEGILRYWVDGDLPLWRHRLGDRGIFSSGSWEVASKAVIAASVRRNPSTRKAEVAFENTEKWQKWFWLDDPIYGLLDEDYNPLY